MLPLWALPGILNQMEGPKARPQFTWSVRTDFGTFVHLWLFSHQPRGRRTAPPPGPRAQTSAAIAQRSGPQRGGGAVAGRFVSFL